MKKFISILSVLTITLQAINPTFAVTTNSQATPWTVEKAEQLARKTLFSANPDIINTLYTAGSVNNAVDILFPDTTWPDRTVYNNEINAFKSQTWFSMTNSNWMKEYYAFKKYRDPYETKAKAFVMLEDIFSVNVDNSTILYSDIENTHNLISENMFWDYKSLVKKIVYSGQLNSWDYTMWGFLNLFNQQYPNSPNENFARELMQLFLILEYKPWENQDNSWAIQNYTNSDVASLARILTWLEANTGSHLTSFNPAMHNTWNFIFLSWSLKFWDSFPFYNSASGTINSNTITTPINGNNWLTDNIVDYIFSKRWNEIADFLAWKLLKYYVKDKPTQAEIESLASQIIANNFNMFASIKYLLKSDIMYSDEAMNTVYYKNPLELTIWTLKLLHYKNPSVIDPLIYDSSLLTNLEWTPYFPGSIFWRDWFDSNAKFFNAYNHNQWVNYSTKLAYYNWWNYYNLADLITTTRVNETWSYLPIITATGNTYSWSIGLTNMNLSLVGWGINSARSVEESYNVAPEEPITNTLLVPTESSTWDIIVENTWSTDDKINSDSTWEIIDNSVKFEDNNQLIQTATGITFTGIIVSLPTFTITASNNTVITISSGSIDMNWRKLNIYSWNFTQSWASYQINWWTADIDINSVLERDINVNETVTQLENYLYSWRRLSDSVKSQITSYLTTDDNGNARIFLPNNTTYRNTILRWVISIMLSQPEFVMNMWFDKQATNGTVNSLLPNSNSKLVFVEMFGWYDWLHAIVQKDNYNDYVTKRRPLAVSSSDMIDLWDYYMNPAYNAFKPLYDSNNLRIVNRVGAPSHSRWHDTAAIQVTSDFWLETVGTPSIIGNLIENESDATKNIVLGNNSPNMYSNGNYLNIGWNSAIYTNYWAWLTASGKISQLNTIKTILNSRTYPGSSSNLFKWSVTIDTVANTSKNSWWQPSSGYSIKQRLDFTKILIDNNLGTTYYVPTFGWYDTHSDEVTTSTWDYDLSDRTRDLSSDLTTFFNSLKNNKDVTIIVYSEFWRTLISNWTNWTDHGQAWGYFILSNNTPLLNSLTNKIIGNENLAKETNDWFWVWIDYRAIYNKILTSLYNIPTTYLGTQYNLDDYINTRNPNPSLFREEFRPNGNNSLYMDIKFRVDDKNFILNEASDIDFYYWTNSGNLTQYSNWSLDNYSLQTDWSYKIGSISVPKNTEYFYRLILRDNQFNEYVINWNFRTPNNYTNSTTTLSWSSDNVLQRYNNTTVTGSTNLWTPLTIFNNSWTWSLWIINWQSGITLEQISTGQTLVNSLFTNSWTFVWNWGFLLPRLINGDTLITDNSNYSWTLLSNLNIRKIIKIGSDIYWVWMRLNNPVRLRIPYSWAIGWRLRIITSEDGINWHNISYTWATFSWWVISFETDSFSFFAVVDEASDTIPNAFDFIDQSNLELNSATESNTITISWIDWPTSIGVNNWEYLINTWSYTTLTWVVNSWDTMKLRLTSATGNSTTRSMIANIWWVTDTWNITTKAASWGGWWGWWWSSFSRDYCPNWDNSSSYYDRTCWVRSPTTSTLTWTTTIATPTTINTPKIISSTVDSFYNKIKQSVNKYNWINKRIKNIDNYIVKIKNMLSLQTNKANQDFLNALLIKLNNLKSEYLATSQDKNIIKPTIILEPLIAPVITPQYWYINTTAQFVVLRKVASLRAEILMQLNNWTQVEVIQISPNWWVQLKYNWTIWYLRKSYLRF